MKRYNQAMPSGIPQPSRRSQAANNTGQEALYLKSLVERQVRVQVKLRDGELLQGVIEYFDANMLRLNRDGKPNLFLYKHHIHTLCEEPRKRISGNTGLRTA
jgi:host factor-I protein